MLHAVIMIIHFVIAVGLVVAVLLQPEKGEGLGVIGGGTTGFAGKRKATEAMLARVTTGLAAAFIVTSVVLTFIVG
ncbi:MAG TPA: preprotein translocase subunit SecG [Firmicutes bacterium]|nr:preprotein translocase subunit SecG [Bacillota bacterium]